jgi:hypothetical protein
VQRNKLRILMMIPNTTDDATNNRLTCHNPNQTSLLTAKIKVDERMISNNQQQQEIPTIMSSLPSDPTLQDQYHEQLDLFNSTDEQSPKALQVFDLIGVLEQILSFLTTTDVVNATLVNSRWKLAGRNDDIWKTFIQRTWRGKKGVTSSTNMIFWRSLFTQDTIRAMKTDDVLCMFRHPLLQTQYETLQDEVAKMESGEASREFLHRFVLVHMLDVLSVDGGNGSRNNNNNSINNVVGDDSVQRPIFFSDLYFGSYASSVLDSRRSILSQQELCTRFGFEMHFKIEEEDADDAIVETSEEFERYDAADGIRLYRYSTCFFQPDGDFRLILRPNVAPTYRPTDLQWRWLEVGKRVQVGPYPSLTVSRTRDWGWKLENLHVVMYSNHGSWPPSVSIFGQ